MQATLYITPAAMETVNAIKDLDYYDRMTLSDDESTDPTGKEGYHLNVHQLRLAILPAGAHIAACIAPDATLPDHGGVSMPAYLRGCVFEKAPQLPDGYADIVAYWSGKPGNADSSGAVYFQCPLNTYMVELLPNNHATESPVVTDRLLSEGVVVRIAGAGTLAEKLSGDDFIEVRLPLDGAMLGVEPDQFRSSHEYRLAPDLRYERIFIRVADIRQSLAADDIYIDVLRHELLDYGYFY